MKKIFSIGLGLVVGLSLCLLVGHAFKSNSISTISPVTINHFTGNGSRRLGSGMNLSGVDRQFSGMSTNDSGVFMRNGSGNFIGGSGNMMTRNMSGSGPSPQQLLDQNVLQK